MDVKYAQDPCPWLIVQQAGAGFMLGTIGGAVFESFRGFRDSPAGITNRMHGSLGAIRTRAPHHGGTFGVWGGLFSTFDCTLQKMRGKEDPWNVIISGALTGGIMAARKRPSSMLLSAFAGGTILAMMEGFNICLNRYTSIFFTPAELVSHRDMVNLVLELALLCQFPIPEDVRKKFEALSNPIPVYEPPAFSNSRDEDQDKYYDQFQDKFL